jgi:uncharacterized membrane protein
MVTMIFSTLYDWLLFAHILFAMVWVGGAVVLMALSIITLRGRDADSVARFVRTLPVLGPAVLAPATIGVVAFGVWLVLDSDAWEFGQAWIVTALALFAVAFLTGAAFQSRTALGAQRAVERGDDGEALRQLTLWVRGYALILALLVAIAWDMVFKPGL